MNEILHIILNPKYLNPMNPCRASLDFLSISGCRPQVLHVHEWQTAAVPMLFWERYYSEGMHSARLVCTLHNLSPNL